MCAALPRSQRLGAALSTDLGVRGQRAATHADDSQTRDAPLVRGASRPDHPRTLGDDATGVRCDPKIADQTGRQPTWNRDSEPKRAHVERDGLLWIGRKDFNLCIGGPSFCQSTFIGARHSSNRRLFTLAGRARRTVLRGLGVHECSVGARSNTRDLSYMMLTPKGDVELFRSGHNPYRS